MKLQTHHLKQIITHYQSKEKEILLKSDSLTISDRKIYKDKYRVYLYTIKLCNHYLKYKIEVTQRELSTIIRTQLLNYNGSVRNCLYDVKNFIDAIHTNN